jgi:hypothetical protein
MAARNSSIPAPVTLLVRIAPAAAAAGATGRSQRVTTMIAAAGPTAFG